jgi:hypothetical protein
MVSYSRIHKKLKLSGNSQFVSGIRRTADGKGFVLIAKSSYDYMDLKCEDGTLMYMGHGKTGDQKMWLYNKQLNDAPMNTPLYVFTRVANNNYKFEGIFKKVQPAFEKTHQGRRVYVFPMKKCVPVVDVPVVADFGSCSRPGAQRRS